MKLYVILYDIRENKRFCILYSVFFTKDRKQVRTCLRLSLVRCRCTTVSKCVCSKCSVAPKKHAGTLQERIPPNFWQSADRFQGHFPSQCKSETAGTKWSWPGPSTCPLVRLIRYGSKLLERASPPAVGRTCRANSTLSPICDSMRAHKRDNELVKHVKIVGWVC